MGSVAAVLATSRSIYVAALVALATSILYTCVMSSDKLCSI